MEREELVNPPSQVGQMPPGILQMISASLWNMGADADRTGSRIANVALSLLSTSPHESAGRPKIGLLDLDIFGPSVPKLMGLENSGDVELSQGENISFISLVLKDTKYSFILPALEIFGAKS